MGGCVVAHSNGVSTIHVKAFLCRLLMFQMQQLLRLAASVATVALSGGAPHYDLVRALEKHQHH